MSKSAVGADLGHVVPAEAADDVLDHFLAPEIADVQIYIGKIPALPV